MGSSNNWLKRIRRNFVKGSSKSPRNIIVVYSNNNNISKSNTSHEETTQLVSSTLTRHDLAVIKIQAHFRGHLARRAFRALRSLVKLQAMVRGGQVRKQSRIAMHCMQALVRLQVRVRARQLLGGDTNNNNNNNNCTIK
ncbi:hypothetical protein G4B88_006963 [Cannabis sativa]|uniref:Uncharacterized protein n=1 Tax=Cannabis sativa TaxID=3483 RepID=A0A7J6G3V3_CANSA|nr:hypothetical protein G4B88_006963 [Cannabis sativa]